MENGKWEKIQGAVGIEREEGRSTTGEKGSEEKAGLGVEGAVGKSVNSYRRKSCF